MTLRKIAGLGALLSVVMPGLAMAADEVAAPVLNSGDTAWMLTATALVLFMTIPGLALFYGGMVRSKNILSVMMQCFAITGLISILWVIYGYSITFDTTGMEQGVTNFNSFIGGFGKAFLAGVTPESLTSSTALFPEAVFITFQMTFAIITPALIVGAFAERMKFSAMLIFMGVWFTLVYAPIAHMVWSGNGGLMWDWGVLDGAHGWSYSEYRLLLDTFSKREKAGMAKGTPREWLYETAVACRVIYDWQRADGTYGKQFVTDTYLLPERQLILASYRLAAVLNDLFG